MTLVKHLKNPALITLCVALFLTGLRIVIMYQRTELHADEIFSYMLARNNTGYIEPLNADTTLTGAQLQQRLHAEHNLAHDLKALHANNLDSPHASLYYMALRIVLQPMHQFNATTLARVGGWLNIIFFLITMWAVCRLVTKWFGQRKAQWAMPLTLMAAFANPPAVLCTLMVREYQMAQMFIVVLALITAMLSDKIRNGQRVGVRPFLWVAIIVAGCMSTGYLNAYIVAVLIGAPILVALYKRRYATAAIIFGAAVVAIPLCLILYQGFFNFMLDNNVHTRRAFSNFAAIPGMVLWRWLICQVVTVPGAILLCAFLFVAIIGKRRAKLLQNIWLPLGAIICMLLVEYTSVLHQQRYIWPLLPLAATLWPIVVNALNKINIFSASGPTIRPTSRPIVHSTSGTMLQPIVALFVSVYLAVIGIATAYAPKYNWPFIQKQLANGAVLYKLNPNEWPQIAPMTNPGANYQFIVHAPDSTHALPVVYRLQPPIKTPNPLPLTGPLKIQKQTSEKNASE